MTDLSLLKVSLTKHNAHKISRLLKKYSAEMVLGRLHEVHAEVAQAHKNLSVTGGKIPVVWAKAKRLGDEAIDALVLVGIIFSHADLIATMLEASDRSPGRGRIERDVHLSGKAYTNFSRIIDQLGFATRLEYAATTFDMRSMLKITGLGPLVAELLGHKLKAARWNGRGTVADEAVLQNFHKIFGASATNFKKWLVGDVEPSVANLPLLPKDEEFFQAAADREELQPFKFRAGHTKRSIENIARKATGKIEAIQLHNLIQNNLYRYFCKEMGAQFVGTEISTGNGTTVDLVTNYNNKITFFEIKTSASIRTSIRQALPQLLEYAYWPSEQRADELVIVSHLPVTESARRYLACLKQKFKLPVLYCQFDLEKNTLTS